MVVDLLDDQLAGDGLPGEGTPADALHVDGGSGELCLQSVEAAEELVDGGCQLALRAAAAVGAHVGPEDAVQHVATDMEGEAARELVDVAEVARLASRRQCIERVVGALHVRSMVLVVMQADDLTAVVRLERAGGVGQFGKCVRRHCRVPSEWLGVPTVRPSLLWSIGTPVGATLKPLHETGVASPRARGNLSG